MKRIVDDEELRQKLGDSQWLDAAKENPDKAIREITTNPLASDTAIYRITVVVLGLAVLTALVGAIWLALAAQETPELLVALGSAAVGALAGLLAPTGGGGTV